MLKSFFDIKYFLGVSVYLLTLIATLIILSKIIERHIFFCSINFYYWHSKMFTLSFYILGSKHKFVSYLKYQTVFKLLYHSSTISILNEKTLKYVLLMYFIAELV